MTQKPLIKVPSLKSGNDSEKAAELKKLAEDAQNALRRVVALGLFCFQIKAQLPHGQFKQWLGAHCPEISYRSLAAYMQLTTGVLEKAKTSIKGFLSKVQSLHFSHGGEILLLPETKIPDSAKTLREKLCSIIDGKTQSQLFLEFKQVDDDDLKPKRGRLKGHGGASKDQRERARQLEEEERLTALTLDSDGFAEWIDENADDKNLGMIRGSKEWKKLREAAEHLLGYMKRADAAAKS